MSSLSDATHTEEDEDVRPALPPLFVARHTLLSGAVLRACVGCFRAPGVTDVVLCRELSLELLSLQPDGMLQARAVA